MGFEFRVSGFCDLILGRVRRVEVRGLVLNIVSAREVCEVQGSGFRVQGSGFRVQDSALRGTPVPRRECFLEVSGFALQVYLCLFQD